MKWSLIGLFALGFVAATCAVLLVLSLRQKPAGPGDGDGPLEEATRTVLVAARALEARHVVATGDLRATEVKVSALPEQFFSDTVQVIGRVLVAPLAEGQPFAPESFPGKGSSMQLATTLPPGMRAVTVMITDDRVTERMLYPGCLVDVVANLDVDPGTDRELVAFPLLENLQVLAVGDRSIVRPEGEPKESTVDLNRYSVVTLLVDPEQAGRLSLAQKEGTISIVLRNPLDEEPTESEPVRLITLLSDMDRRPPARATDPVPRDKLDLMRAELEELRLQKELEDARQDLEQDGTAATTTTTDPPAEPPEEKPVWNTLILRGGQQEIKTFATEGATPE